MISARHGGWRHASNLRVREGAFFDVQLNGEHAHRAAVRGSLGGLRPACGAVVIEDGLVTARPGYRTGTGEAVRPGLLA